MNLVTPDLGLIFWTGLVFLILFFLLKKFAWKPILSAVKDREESIESALQSAKKAKEEMANLTANNEKILKEARYQRDELLKDAKSTKEEIISKAKEDAKAEVEKIMSQAKVTMENEKKAVITDLKNQVAGISIEIAEKILKKELESKDSQSKLVEDLLKDVKLN